MTKKELCKRLNLKRPHLLDQWIETGKMPEPEHNSRGWRVYTEKHYHRAVELLDN